MPKRKAPTWLPYPVAATSIVAASGIGSLLAVYLGDNVLYITFFAAVAFSAWYGGFGPAAFAGLLSYAIANWYFIPRDRAFALNVPTFAYLFVCLLIALFSEAMRRALRRAEASAERVVSIVESINDGFVAIDSDGRATYVNRAAEEYSARQRQTGSARTRDAVFPLSIGGAVEARLRKAAGDAVAVEFEHRDGERWFEIKGTPAEGGGLAIHFRDITERKLAELALAESEERLRLAQQGAKAGLFDSDLVTGQSTWSSEFYEIYGFDRARPPSLEQFFAAMHPDDRAAVTRAFDQAIAARQPLDVEYRVVHPQKGERWISTRGRTLADTAGAPLRISGISLDVTQRKQAEENLRFLSESGNVLSALVDLESTMQKIARLAVPVLADWCVVNIFGQFGEAEYVAQAHRHRDKEPALKRLVDYAARVRGSSVLSLEENGTTEFQSEVAPGALDAVARDAEHRELLAALNPVSYIVVPLSVRERVIGCITFATAESGRHYSAADVEMATELAHRSAVAIDNARLYKELKEAQRQKDDFLAMLAHELRNPLAAILYANELLKMTGNAQSPAAEVIDRQLASLTHLIDDLLDVSRITQDKIQLKKELVDGATVARRAISTARPLIESRRHELVVEISDQQMPLEADSVRVEQILVNLLTNAAKYTPERGRITVRAFPSNDQAIFKVQDTGIGIPAEMLPRVFELFTQVDQSLDRSQGGLGIGLTVVRKLVEKHGGRVSVKSDGAGCGSEFTVGLPLSQATVIAPPAAVSPATISAAQKVLVVDDNVDTAQSISNLLERKGYTAAMAHDGHAALELARKFSPDVVLLDLGLPGLDGYRVAQMLRKEAEFANVRLIALSGYGQPADKKRSQEAGFNEHLVKPVAFHTLLTMLSTG